MTRDFSKMRFRVDVKQPMKEVYPELSSVKSFSYPESDEDKLIRFAMLIADENSPTASMKTFESRVKDSLVIAGFKKSDFGSEFMTKIIDFGDSRVLDMIVDCFRLCRDQYLFDTWTSKVILFFQCSRQLVQPIDMTREDSERIMEVKMKISERMDVLKEDIIKSERNLFKDPYLEKIVKDFQANQNIDWVMLHAEENVTE